MLWRWVTLILNFYRLRSIRRPFMGYQITGYYSITSRYGTPEQFMYLVNRCHQRGIGSLWTGAGSLLQDDHGLRFLTALPCMNMLIWKKRTSCFGAHWAWLWKAEVICFLIRTHCSGWINIYWRTAVDAVASMMELNLTNPLPSGR